ncbi:MAG: hypothetical protein JSW53_05735 [Candidatus Bathyarchaeota archaeon]|nr:MAG: hypothetical protein JSW53_05735 [Candidatus Bathyarchaeota archaeon]
MSRARVVKEELEANGVSFLAVYLETRNADLILLSEGEDQLGTLAVAIPQEDKLVGPPLSSILLGDRNVTTARVLAERLAKTVSKMALVSVFTKTVSEADAGSILLKLLRKTIEKERVEA